MTTVNVRDVHGHESALDVPEEGTVAYELWLDHLAHGRYVVIDDGDAPASDSTDSSGSPEVVVPDDLTTIDAILDWVNGDPFARLEIARDHEAAGKARPTLLKALVKLHSDLVALGETSDDGPTIPTGPGVEDEPPDGSVDEVLAWVNEAPAERVSVAYRVEKVTKARPDLLAALESIAEVLEAIDGKTSVDGTDGPQHIGPGSLVNEKTPDTEQVGSTPVPNHED